jgi:hypothetical protein
MKLIKNAVYALEAPDNSIRLVQATSAFKVRTGPMRKTTIYFTEGVLLRLGTEPTKSNPLGSGFQPAAKRLWETYKLTHVSKEALKTALEKASLELAKEWGNI